MNYNMYNICYIPYLLLHGITINMTITPLDQGDQSLHS